MLTVRGCFFEQPSNKGCGGGRLFFCKHTPTGAPLSSTLCRPNLKVGSHISIFCSMAWECCPLQLVATVMLHFEAILGHQPFFWSPFQVLQLPFLRLGPLILSRPPRDKSFSSSTSSCFEVFTSHCLRLSEGLSGATHASARRRAPPDLQALLLLPGLLERGSIACAVTEFTPDTSAQCNSSFCQSQNR